MWNHFLGSVVQDFRRRRRRRSEFTKFAKNNAIYMKNQVWGAGTWWALKGMLYSMLGRLGLVVYLIDGVLLVVRVSEVRR